MQTGGEKYLESPQPLEMKTTRITRKKPKVDARTKKGGEEEKETKSSTLNSEWRSRKS